MSLKTKLKLIRELRSVKFYLILFSCAALYQGKLTGLEWTGALGILIGSRTVNETRFEKDSS